MSEEIMARDEAGAAGGEADDDREMAAADEAAGGSPGPRQGDTPRPHPKYEGLGDSPAAGSKFHEGELWKPQREGG